jgi:hypothetical protein
MDLWTLPLGTPCTTANHSNKAMTLLAVPDFANTHAQSPTNNVFFMHTVQNKANSIRFAHQSLCSPRISMLLKAICHATNSLISNVQPFPATNANVIQDNDTSSDANIFVLPPLWTNEQEFYITILPEPFPSSPLRAKFASSSYTIAKRMLF